MIGTIVFGTLLCLGLIELVTGFISTYVRLTILFSVIDDEKETWFMQLYQEDPEFREVANRSARHTLIDACVVAESPDELRAELCGDT